MSVFNGARYVSGAIDSILAQGFEDFELIIVDDGSTDQTSKILSSIKDDRLKIYTHSVNMGIVVSLNDGIKASVGKYIARMDCDDLSDPNRFSIQVDFLDTHLDYAAVGSFVKVISPSGKILYTIEQPTRDLAIKGHLLHDSCIAHGSVMMRKSALEDVALYSTDSNVIHAEDYDLYVRLAAKYKLANISQYLYTRIEHSASISHIHSLTQQKSSKYISKKARNLIRLPSKLPKFSIIMPNYNKGLFIQEAINSVVSQSMKDWELIIIDDHSSDDSVEKIQPFLKDPRIILLINPKNLGIAKTLNRGISDSLSQVFGELDSDDVLVKTAIYEMYLSHINNSQSGFIYSQFAYCDSNLKQYDIGFCRKGKPNETNLHTNYVSAFRTYKRKYFEMTSKFSPQAIGCADKDIIYKMEEVTKLHFVDKVLYKYRLIPQHEGHNTMVGLTSHIKVKVLAYLRRRKTSIPNISVMGLIRQILNIFITLFQIFLGTI